MLKKVLHSVATVVAFAALVAIALQVLCTQTYATTGILTLKVRRHPLAIRSQDCNSSLSAPVTRVVSAADQAESAIDSAATSLQGVEEGLTRNCSLGMKHFCIGYKHESNCSDLPLNLFGLLAERFHELPAFIEDSMRDRAQALSQPAGNLTNLSAIYMPSTLISRLLLMSVVIFF